MIIYMKIFHLDADIIWSNNLFLTVLMIVLGKTY